MCSADVSSDPSVLLARGTAVVGSLWVRLYLMFRCSSPANKLISVTFLGEFSFGCLPFSYSRQSVFGYGVRGCVTFPKLSVSRTGRLLCGTDSGPRPACRAPHEAHPASLPFLIPTFRAAYLCVGRARTHCCVLYDALPSCLNARLPPPRTPPTPTPKSVFCQPAFRHGEGRALCILVTVVFSVRRHSAWPSGCFVFATSKQERMPPLRKASPRLYGASASGVPMGWL